MRGSNDWHLPVRAGLMVASAVPRGGAAYARCQPEGLAGRRPFDGTSALGIIHAVLTTTPPSVKTLRPDVPPELEAIAARTLVRECERRTVTAAAVRDLAAACHARLSSGEWGAVPRPRAPRRRWIVAAALAAGTERHIAGGAWDEPAYTFNGPEAQSPFARHATHGFRCIKVDRPDNLSPELTARIDLPLRDLRKAKPVSQPVFEEWRRLLYTFDHSKRWTTRRASGA